MFANLKASPSPSVNVILKRASILQRNGHFFSIPSK